MEEVVSQTMEWKTGLDEFFYKMTVKKMYETEPLYMCRGGITPENMCIVKTMCGLSKTPIDKTNFIMKQVGFLFYVKKHGFVIFKLEVDRLNAKHEE